MSERDWLEKLKVGDKVIAVNSNALYGKESVGFVVRFTANFIVVKAGGFEHKFRKESGWEGGSGYHRMHLNEATPEVIQDLLLRIKQSNVQKYVESKVAWSTVPKDVIDQLYVLLDPFVKEDKTNE